MADELLQLFDWIEHLDTVPALPRVANRKNAGRAIPHPVAPRARHPRPGRGAGLSV